MTRIEIIAQLDAEINRLARARDFLAAALQNANIVSTREIVSAATAKPAVVGRVRKQKPVVAAAPVVVMPAATATVRPEQKLEQEPEQKSEQKSSEPQVHRVPPRRRMERRQSQTEKAPSAALGGLVPAGPVAVSANEARKMQERAVQPAPTPASVTLNEGNGERSLGSLIQAFERRTGVTRIETS